MQESSLLADGRPAALQDALCSLADMVDATSVAAAIRSEFRSGIDKELSRFNIPA